MESAAVDAVAACRVLGTRLLLAGPGVALHNAGLPFLAVESPMSAPHVLEDPLDGLVGQDDQRRAALLVQQAFASAFRLSVGEAGGALDAVVDGLDKWGSAGDAPAACAARRAMLLSGLDQWGVAYTQAFGLNAIPALTHLLGTLRSRLNPEDDARFQRQFSALTADELAGIDFKVDLRRSIHLALWHAMIASDNADDAQRILECLGGLMRSLVSSMPRYGWRLLADTLASIQISCLAEGLAQHGLARETTQRLLGAVNQSLDPALRDQVNAHAAQALMAWQQARRKHAH